MACFRTFCAYTTSFAHLNSLSLHQSRRVHQFASTMMKPGQPAQPAAQRCMLSTACHACASGRVQLGHNLLTERISGNPHKGYLSRASPSYATQLQHHSGAAKVAGATACTHWQACTHARARVAHMSSLVAASQTRVRHAAPPHASQRQEEHESQEGGEPKAAPGQQKARRQGGKEASTVTYRSKKGSEPGQGSEVAPGDLLEPGSVDSMSDWGKESESDWGAGSETAGAQGRADSAWARVVGRMPREELESGLYLVGTPIGNLRDITLRALAVLRSAHTVLAEDTRHTHKLLSFYGIKAHMISYHAHNEHSRVPAVVARLVAGEPMALVSDAGMPGISDPGHALVVAAVEAGVKVVPVPGPCAFVAALVASGLPTSTITFLGFLPHKQGARRTRLSALRHQPGTLAFYVPPHALVAVLEDMGEVLGGGRRVAVARELTKVYEEVFRSTLAGAATEFRTRDPRGEMCVVVEGASEGEVAAAAAALAMLRPPGGAPMSDLDPRFLGAPSDSSPVFPQSDSNSRSLQRGVSVLPEGPDMPQGGNQRQGEEGDQQEGNSDPCPPTTSSTGASTHSSQGSSTTQDVDVMPSDPSCLPPKSGSRREVYGGEVGGAGVWGEGGSAAGRGVGGGAALTPEQAVQAAAIPLLRRLKAQGVPQSAAAKEAARQLGVGRKVLYDLALHVWSH